MNKVFIFCIVIYISSLNNCFSGNKIPQELRKVLKQYYTLNEFLVNSVFDKEISGNKNLAIYRFIKKNSKDSVYIAWSRNQYQQYLNEVNGNFWVFDTSQMHSNTPLKASGIILSSTPVFLFPATDLSDAIDSIFVRNSPIEPFPSDGDLWLSTWANDDNIYSGWGDGKGPLIDIEPIPWVDCGIVRLSGNFPYISAKTMFRDDPAPPLEKNDKPSSFIYLDSCLYGQFHSPLGDARIGYISCSYDFGATWERIGFYNEGDKISNNVSPWTRKKNSPYRCLFFINMGKNYGLNTDGYVYALGIGTEWHWMDLNVYLARVKKESLTRYDAYEYFMGLDVTNQPTWTEKQENAIPVNGLITMGQGSAIYHPGIRRYLFMTDKDVFDSPNPWGPWTFAGNWTTWKDHPGNKEWQGGYQPGIISKDTGPDSFWFTISGQNKKPYVTYTLNIGEMVMVLKDLK